MDQVDRDKWSVIHPEKEFIVAIDYNSIEVAQQLYSILNLPTISPGFSEPTIEDNKVTVKCKNWSTVKRLEDMARRAKLEVYERKFEKIL